MNTKTSKNKPEETIVSIIVISKNDVDIIKDQLHQIHNSLRKLNSYYEILIIDNNSQDDTVKAIKSFHKKIPQSRTLVLSRNYDTEIALTAGLDSCVGDYAILLNFYTDPPLIIPAIYSLLWENDIVIGKHTQDILKRNLLTSLLISLTKKFSRREYRHAYNYTLGLNRKAINSLTRTRRKSRRFDYLSSVIGLKKFTFEFKPQKRFKKRIKQETFPNIFASIMDTTISNSFRPLRIFSAMGMIASILFFLYVLLIIVIEILGYDVAPKGWISTALVISVMFLILFTLLLFIAEYIIRSVTEARDEPLYFVSDEIDKSVIIPEDTKLNISK